ncbi:hypothetical protein PFISCL1PPCAC_21932, partial [Pristionchus fissidentatus]
LRVAYWSPLCAFAIITIALYVRLMLLIYKKRASPQFNTFFYKMFVTAGIFDLISIFWYISAQWTYVDQVFGARFLLTLNHDNIPNLCYYYIYYFLYAQIFVILLISANRLIAIHSPQSAVLKSCDSFPLLLLLIAT